MLDGDAFARWRRTVRIGERAGRGRKQSVELLGRKLLRHIACRRNHAEETEIGVAAIDELMRYERPDVDDVVLAHLANGVPDDRIPDPGPMMTKCSCSCFSRRDTVPGGKSK